MAKMSGVLTVIATYRARPGTGDEIAEVLHEHGQSSRVEPGCLRFDAYRAVEDPDRFWLFEQYVDETAFEAHRRTPHFRENVEGRIAPLLSERAWARVGQL